MKKNRNAIFLLIMLILGLTSIFTLNASTTLVPLVVDGTNVYHYNSSDPVMTPDTYVEQDTEFRGVWIATVSNINMSATTSESNFQAQFDALLDQVESVHANAIIFQVRPMNDAYYDSQYAPWSQYLTGTEGLDPGWDPMAYMVSESHARGIEFHAWLNPYRVKNTSLSKNTMISNLHAENYAKSHPEYVVEGTNDTAFILNPGEPEVREYIANVVDEIMDLYDVDGIHFDDYFYPYGGLDYSEDLATYNTYNTNGLSQADFRRESVNQTIAGVKAVVDTHNDAEGTDVRFGVSPGGVWQVGGSDGVDIGPASQSYSSLFADSKKWVEEGWVHYINPQIYWGFNHSIAPYADIVTWWADLVRGTDVDLYIGHGIYREADNTSEWSSEEIAAELTFNQQFPEIKGSVLYRAGFFNTAGMINVKNNYWTTTPLQTRETSSVESPEYTLSGTMSGSNYIDDITLTLTSTVDAYYKIGINGEWQLYSEPVLFDHNGLEVVYIKAVDGLDESLVTGIDLEINRVNLDQPTYILDGDQLGDDYLLDTTLTVNAESQPIWYKINHGNVGIWTLYDEPIVFDDTGSYYVSLKTIDDHGIESNVVNISLTIVENIYPDPSISVVGVGQYPYFSEATITLSSEAPEVSYKINDGAWQTYTAAFTLDEEGTYNIFYRNEDDLANELSESITIDLENPDIPSISITGEKVDLYYKEEVSVTFEQELDDIYYRIHNGSTWSSWQLYEGTTLSFVFNATYTIQYYAQDEALNQSVTESEIIRVDIDVQTLSKYVIRDGEIVTYYHSDEAIELPETYTEKTEEIRAVWVATVSNIDIGMHYNKTDYQNEILSMLNRLEALNFNTMFFQVRPMNDAYYESDYAPWSRYIMGAEGVDPGWDILEFIIDEAHQRGIEFHAWLNPYRVSTDTGTKTSQLASLSDDNFAKQNPDLVMQDSAGKLILNPGEPRVRAYINNVVSELMSKYDVDGIHFDDYFYSYNGMADSEDAATYDRYKEDNESLDDWRRSNVDTLVEGLSSLISNWNTQRDTKIKFGISPFGIWSSGGVEGSNTSTGTMQSYSDQYADTKKWVEEGWLDYILPQLYWEFDHGSAPFADLVDWWAELCEANDVDLIIGHGFYRYADGSWDYQNEFSEQLRYISQYDSVIGSALFSYKTLNSFNNNVIESIDQLQTSYWTAYPSFPWDSDVVKSIEAIEVPVYQINGVQIGGSTYEVGATLTFTSDADVYYKTGTSGDGEWILYTDAINLDELGSFTITFKSVDGDQESNFVVMTISIVEAEDEDGLGGINPVVYIASSIIVIGFAGFFFLKKFKR
jgi:uncharacterized lipoprotein YddW (UPF0748 family)